MTIHYRLTFVAAALSSISTHPTQRRWSPGMQTVQSGRCVRHSPTVHVHYDVLCPRHLSLSVSPHPHQTGFAASLLPSISSSRPFAPSVSGLPHTRSGGRPCQDAGLLPPCAHKATTGADFCTLDVASNDESSIGSFSNRLVPTTSLSDRPVWSRCTPFPILTWVEGTRCHGYQQQVNRLRAAQQ